MKRLPQIRAFVLALVGLMGMRPPALDDPPRQRGSLATRIEQAAGIQFGEGSNRFRPATQVQQQIWKAAIRAILNGQWDDANRLLATLPYPYELLLFTDASNEREYLLLQEKTPIQAGWGTYVFDLNSVSPLVVEVPHPRADLRTENEGIDIFLATRGLAFLMAGTHRRANDVESPCDTKGLCGEELQGDTRYKESDAGHSLVTMFQPTHEVLAVERPRSIAASIHGMAESTACPDAFLSSGAGNVTEITRQLLRCLIERGVNAELYSGVCRGCSLAGTTNLQGRFSNNPGLNPCITSAPFVREPGRFLHLEQEPALRRDAASWRPVVEAFSCAFASTSRGIGWKGTCQYRLR